MLKTKKNNIHGYTNNTSNEYGHHHYPGDTADGYFVDVLMVVLMSLYNVMIIRIVDI